MSSYIQVMSNNNTSSNSGNSNESDDNYFNGYSYSNELKNIYSQLYLHNLYNKSFNHLVFNTDSAFNYQLNKIDFTLNYDYNLNYLREASTIEISDEKDDQPTVSVPIIKSEIERAKEQHRRDALTKSSHLAVHLSHPIDYGFGDESRELAFFDPSNRMLNECTIRAISDELIKAFLNDFTLWWAYIIRAQLRRKKKDEREKKETMNDILLNFN